MRKILQSGSLREKFLENSCNPIQIFNIFAILIVARKCVAYNRPKSRYIAKKWLILRPKLSRLNSPVSCETSFERIFEADGALLRVAASFQTRLESTNRFDRRVVRAVAIIETKVPPRFKLRRILPKQTTKKPLNRPRVMQKFRLTTKGFLKPVGRKI